MPIEWQSVVWLGGLLRLAACYPRLIVSLLFAGRVCVVMWECRQTVTIEDQLGTALYAWVVLLTSWLRRLQGSELLGCARWC